MNLKNLLSGIAVAIDDALDPAALTSDDRDRNGDVIVEILERLEQESNVVFYRASAMPPEDTWPHLLQSASFILLDWKLWPNGAHELEKIIVEAYGRFLKHARDYLVPVFIFTNENTEDVVAKLPKNIYRKDTSDRSFVFIQTKEQLLSDASPVIGPVQEWMRMNPSVYALKTWDHVVRVARNDLFGSMYAKNPNWPKVFWGAYRDDGVDPSLSLTQLINDSLRSRIQAGAFENDILTDLGASNSRVPVEDLRSLIGATAFQDKVPEDEIRCGDLFKKAKGKFLLNIRPDCDCIPRGDPRVDPIARLNAVDLYCIEGKKMRPSELREEYRHKGGNFAERDDQGIVFAAAQGTAIRFKFKKLCIKRFGDLKERRIGRLLHPYLTRIQQRYALYLQRQGLPRIPKEAIPFPPGDG